MTIRTIRRTITFHRPVYLKGVERLLPPGDYDVVTDEELIEGIVVPGLPSDFDGNVCAREVWVRRRDGDGRACGP